MGHRLSKITTRTGDDGSTGLADGRRVPKSHPRVEALGEVDELNSQIGLLLAEDLPADLRGQLFAIQHALFDLGGALALPNHAVPLDRALAELDQAIAHYNADLAPLTDFILPGGSRAAALAHMARCICRRAERRLAVLAEATPAEALPYLNRLSDLLFVFARLLNRQTGAGDTVWQAQR